LDLGTGLKIKELTFKENSTEGLSGFIHSSGNIKWNFDPNWSYVFQTSYNLDLIKLLSNIYISIGVNYLF